MLNYGLLKRKLRKVCKDSVTLISTTYVVRTSFTVLAAIPRTLNSLSIIRYTDSIIVWLTEIESYLIWLEE
jgi:hypothetical protein